MRKLLALGALALVLAACGSGTGASSSEPDPTDAPAVEETTAPTEEPVAESTPEPTEAPTEEPAPTPEDNTFEPGEVVVVTESGEPWANIVVDKVRQVKKYDGEYLDDTPEQKGNVFIEARVTYEALTDGVDYNPFDWAVFVDDRAVDNYAFVSNGPTPDLSSGTLPKGRSAQGYVVYEVPASGRVVMSYGGNQFLDEPPVFEVVLRAE